MRPTELLSAEDLDTIERGWQRLVTEIGIEFDHDDALALLAEAGQRIEGRVAFLDPDWVLEQVAKAPSEFDLRARDDGRTVTVGGTHMAFASVSGPPFFRVGEERRVGRLADYELMTRLVDHFDELDLVTMPVIEPDDRPLDSRHLDMLMAATRLTSKPVLGSALSTGHAEDSVEWARMVHGEPIWQPEAAPRPLTSIASIINVNSPLRYDTRMLEALLVYAAAGQAVIVTPFLLMGAMSPVTVPAALAQQTAEALAGVALIETVREGAPVVMGSFLSTVDMQSGSPSFGGPESAQGLIASGQLARRYGLPWRAGGGGLTASQCVDAQAGYESFNTLHSAFAAGANLVVQSAGWLEGGLVSSPEKLVHDVEILRMLRCQFTPLQVDEESLAFGEHNEVGQGGHFLVAMQTLERFRHCFYRPLLSSTENYERWTSRGAKDTAVRAGDIWREIVAGHEPPKLDADLAARLEEYVVRRRREVGDL